MSGLPERQCLCVSRLSNGFLQPYQKEPALTPLSSPRRQHSLHLLRNRRQPEPALNRLRRQQSRNNTPHTLARYPTRTPRHKSECGGPRSDSHAFPEHPRDPKRDDPAVGRRHSLRTDSAAC
jgi:hypothetical protein